MRKIVSGGQSGVDRAALDAARALGMPAGGWCPRGRIAEDGSIRRRYRMLETPSAGYVERTEWNARDSDATLIVVRVLNVAGPRESKRPGIYREARRVLAVLLAASK